MWFWGCHHNVSLSWGLDNEMVCPLLLLSWAGLLQSEPSIILLFLGYASATSIRNRIGYESMEAYNWG